MRRIRTIKPEYFESETVSRVGIFARLLFIGLWTIADDAGRLRGATRLIASNLFAYDENVVEQVETALTDLENQNLIRRYLFNNSTYISISGWQKHQKIDRPSISKLPGPDDFDVTTELPANNSPKVLENFENNREVSSNAREGSTTDLDQEVDRDQDQDCGKTRSVTRETRAKTACRIPADWTLSDADRQYALAQGLRPEPVAEAFFDYWRASGSPNAAKLDWQAAWRTWCRNQTQRTLVNTTNLTPNASASARADATAANQRRMQEIEKKFAPYLPTHQCPFDSRTVDGDIL